MIAQQLTFRERQLIAAFRNCDERGRAFVERTAVDQAELSRMSTQRPIANVAQLIHLK